MCSPAAPPDAPGTRWVRVGGTRGPGRRGFDAGKFTQRERRSRSPPVLPPPLPHPAEMGPQPQQGIHVPDHAPGGAFSQDRYTGGGHPEAADPAQHGGGIEPDNLGGERRGGHVARDFAGDDEDVVAPIDRAPPPPPRPAQIPTGRRPPPPRAGPAATSSQLQRPARWHQRPAARQRSARRWWADRTGDPDPAALP